MGTRNIKLAVAAIAAGLSFATWAECGDCGPAVPPSSGVYDGNQANTLVEASVAGERRATLSLRVQIPAGAAEDRTYVILAEHGDPKKDAGTLRLSFNVRRERRICGFYGDTRVYSAPGVLDDGLLHHVALDVEPGREMTLFVDGEAVAKAAVPDRGFAAGAVSVARRAFSPDATEKQIRNLRWSRFRGRIADVALKPGAFDAAAVAGGVAAREAALELPPADPPDVPARWERPKTTRRYLQGPFAERLLVFWREGKIVFGEIDHKDDWSLEYKTDVRAHAAWLVHGADDEAFDFRKAELRQPEGGEPDHSQVWREGPLEVELAACAPWGRKPSAFVRLTVKNTGDAAVTEPFAFLLREGLESRLAYGAPDVYIIFNPSAGDWASIPVEGWARDGDAMRHGDRFAAFAGGGFEWDGDKGAARFRVSLQPGESRSFELELGRGESGGEGYAAARASMYGGWAGELAKLTLPEWFDAGKKRIVRNMAVQMLQCLSTPVGEDFVLPRQGGLQRYVWPGDAVSFLEGLDAIGYGEYVAKAIDFYYTRCQRENGEAGPFKNNWAGDTASILLTFARHCTVTGDEACWRRYRDAAFRAFGWIESKRAEGGGLFPSMKASDHKAVLRAWGSNDLKGLEAYAALLKASRYFEDPRADEIAAAEKSYRAALTAVMDVCRSRSEGKDELEVPMTADGADDPFLEEFMFYLHPGRFADNGLLTADEMLRLRTWLIRRGYANENGLYANQISTNPDCRDHIWYTTWTELQWFRAWRRAGRADLAAKALDACLKYALTDELYVGERYHDSNPWYYPWSPNASGSGRIVMMLLEQND